MTRLVIFDWDGTLADSHDGIIAAMGEAFARHGLAVPAPAAIRAIIGRSLDLAIAELAGAHGAARVEAIAASYGELFVARQTASPDPLFDGAEALVRRLAAGAPHVRLAIATGKKRPGLERALGPSGIGHLFHTLQTADVAASKPDPEMVLNAMIEAGTEPHQTVMVGDSVLDMAMARAAGVRALGVTWGSDGAAALRAAGADAVVGDFRGLGAAIFAFLAPAALAPADG